MKLHKSRFHDEKGHLLDPGGFIYLPHCICTTFLRLAFRYRPSTPWLGYRAIKYLEGLLQPDWQILEWGSGSSTYWFAQRAGNVVSIESLKDWYDEVNSKLNRLRLKNVTYRYKPEHDSYISINDFPDHSFDFILIDGSFRGDCAKSALSKLKPGGYIYLDNSDKHSTKEGGDTRVAEQVLLEAVQEKSGTVQYFVDLIPTYLSVSQGMLVKL